MSVCVHPSAAGKVTALQDPPQSAGYIAQLPIEHRGTITVVAAAAAPDGNADGDGGGYPYVPGHIRCHRWLALFMARAKSTSVEKWFNGFELQIYYSSLVRSKYYVGDGDG